MKTKKCTTKLKRKIPPEGYPDKVCKWCGKILKRQKQPLSAWNLISTCGKSCATNWRWNQISKFQYDMMHGPEVERFCLHCEHKLIRRYNEHKQAWVKRRFCSKSCAAFRHSNRQVTTSAPVVSNAILSGCKIYTQGTPEFEALAQMYMKKEKSFTSQV